MITSAGQAKVSGTASLFTCAVSYGSLTDGLNRAFRVGWISQGLFVMLYIACVLLVLGIAAAAAAGCMSAGNRKLKNLGNFIAVAGGAAQLVGSVLILVFYFLMIDSADMSKITMRFPNAVWIYIVIGVAVLLLSIAVMILVPKADKGEHFAIESKYKLFLMIMPFLVLCFAFSYLPLFSWRYAFFDYTAGGEISWDNFVGLKWFKILFQNEAYTKRLLTVMKNTLAMSGLGLLTSWLPMVFAIFLAEMKSTKYRRFVQTFTTIPNFISWVLIYAIAFAMFNTDGFINTLLQSFGVNATDNYLGGNSHMWLKMLAWGTWKGVGWSAIIYISGIAGIDQQLYEAATVDGAGRFQRMLHITLPGLLPTYTVMLIMSIAGILSNGMDQYLVFTNAQNKYSLEVLDLYVYNLGIGNGDIPLSTVVGMMKSIIAVVLLFVANRVAKSVRGENIV
ncbi:MAG: ABC transporter permease subunit [Lachnospiraceae bacterium]|nr:ABC transporter permease subunit [Lachnospiraceae bacterium]MDE7240134.1 ABC transporter permease subunit [Lachnospiraceae bacterium]